jgi:hypothetical protein
MKINYKNPTHTTLLNWIHKIGYYELTIKKEKADDWIIILDESIQMGLDKVLVIYGIRESKIDFMRPLQFQDLVPLIEITKEKWTAEIIRDVVLSLRDELGNIKYSVADYGNDIRKAMQLARIPHIHDLTHKIALILEKRFEKNFEYVELIKNMSDMRLRYSQTKIGHVVPPKQRKKSRYQNIKIISDWCEKSLNYIQNNENPDPEVCDKLIWLLKYERLIKELAELNRIINEIEKILKYNGLSEETEKECRQLLDKLKSEDGICFKQQVIEYINEMKSLIPGCEKILMSSDIIESAFGKYKNYVNLNPMSGITNLILCLAAFTASLTEERVKEALEKTTIYDVNEWTKKFVGKTLLQKRKEVLCTI